LDLHVEKKRNFKITPAEGPVGPQSPRGRLTSARPNAFPAFCRTASTICFDPAVPILIRADLSLCFEA
jgi:hypothetical protein